MACTTILVGKKASYDGSTIVARNEDSSPGEFNPKKFIVVDPKDQPRKYKSVISHVEIDLPDNPLRYTCMPDALNTNGIWGAAGVNSLNISMSATETITSNDRVLSADPLVEYVEEHIGADGKRVLEKAGGIGEEDMVTLVLPYIKSAKEGVIRLGSLLEEYGTYEKNGIAFQDVGSIWWLETIGGHHWIAKRVPDDSYVIMPNQLGIDTFDLEDAFGKQENYMCSKDLKEFIKDNFLDLSLNGTFNPRLAFGSNTDSDRVYNTPRAWIAQKFLNPSDESYSPISGDIPFSRIPERRVTIEDVKYILSNHYQYTKYDPYNQEENKEEKFRPIGVNRTNFVACVQLRPYKDERNMSIEWLAVGSNVFNALVPFYANVNKTPEYLNNTSSLVTTDNFYWANRIIGALSDAHYKKTISVVDAYKAKVFTKGHEIIKKYDKNIDEAVNIHEYLERGNQEIADMVKEETYKLLDKVVYIASLNMKNNFSRAD